MPFAAALLVAAALTQSLPPWDTGQSRPEDLRVSLVTFGPGDTLTEWWGHSALMVEDTRLDHARIYNYGMFDFSSGFVHKFVQGRLEFWVADAPVGWTFNLYRELNRDIRVQVLNLQPAQAAQIAKALADNVLPQNRMYLYQHYDDNCSTRPRDLIDRAFGGQLKAATSGPARMTLREHTRRYSQVNPPMSVILDFLQNDSLDHPATQQQEAFLPDELERQLDALTVTFPDGTRGPAVRSKRLLFEARRAPVPERAPNWIPQLLLLGVVVGLLPVGLARWARGGKRLPRVLWGSLTTLVGLSWGVLGLGLFFLATFTDHLVTHHDENLFLANPVTFALLPLGIMLIAGARRARPALRWTWTVLAGLSVLGVLLKVLPMFDQANGNLIVLLLPMNVGFAAAAWLDYRWAGGVGGQRAS